MQELTTDNLPDYLLARQLVPSDCLVQIQWLSGGVSNVVYLVTPNGQPAFVIKQSRAQLRTKADWFSRIDRIFREIDAQRVLSETLPPGTVPVILYEDRENYCYAMSAVRPDHHVWKQQLLAGQVETSVFEQSGNLLGRLHATTTCRTDLTTAFEDTTVFFELRIDPFYRRIAEVHPELAAPISQLIDEMAAHRICLTHADFSPKNILVHPDGITLVDYETVHLGDPAFDLGFFFSHLWLKAIALPACRESLISGIDAGWQCYQNAIKGMIDIESLSRRAVRHLAACLLSRIDGKSTVDYLHDPRSQQLVRERTLAWLRTPPADLKAAFQDFTTYFPQG